MLKMLILKNHYFFLAYAFLVPNIIHADEMKTIIDDSTIKSLRAIYDCAPGKEKKVCKALDLFLNSGKPPETANKGSRFIDIGYLVTKSGEEKKLLGLVDYQFTSDFHRKIYFPNKICGTYVIPTRSGEEEIINSAIKSLDANDVPKANAAYKWAENYGWSKSGLCGAAELSSSKNLLYSKELQYFLRYSNGTYVLLAFNWSSFEVPFVMLHSRKRSK